MKKLKLKSGLKLTKFEFFSRLVAWLEHHFTGVGHTTNIQRLLSKMFRILDTRGKPEAIRYVKKTRLELLKVLEETSKERLCSSDRNAIKFPKDLRFLKKVQSDRVYPVIRLVLSVLAVFRFLKGDGIPSFSTILQGSSLSGFPTEVGENILPFLRSLGLNPKKLGVRSSKLDFKKFKMTVKEGPKGHALWTSYLDLLSLPEGLRTSIGIVGGKRLQEDMSNYLAFIPYTSKYFEKHLGETRMSLRRLSVLRDKEGKNREIAILDYYSQQALRPLHNYLFKLIARIPQDCTFDHSRGIDLLERADGSSFHSIDLSNATDRFPISLQKYIISTMFGNEYSEHWQNIMVGYPFDYRGASIAYATGNPMGAYSSWAVFVLAHHFLVFLACKKAKVSWKRCPYILIGDDIVIANDTVADAYLELLQRFDIPYGVEKSHRSPYLFEFAKRFIHEGTEISPFPLAGLFENRNNWLLAIGTIFEESFRKRWEPRIDILQSSLGYLKSIGYNSSFISKHSLKLEIVLMMRESHAGRRPMASVLQRAAFLRHGEEFLEDMKLFPAEYYVPQVMIPSYQRLFRTSLSQITDKRNTKPLGLIAEDLTVIATSLFGVVEDPFLFIRSCPILQVYGEVEETYLRLAKMPMNDKALIKGEFHNFLEEVSLPTGDESFYIRRKDVLQLATSRLVDQVLDTLDQAKKDLRLFHPMIY